MIPRVAYLSPVPPAKTGVAEHAAAVLPELARRLELTVFADLEPGAPRRAAGLAVEHVVGFLRRAAAFDSVVYQIGNSEPHRALLDALFHVPGIVELHDTVLHHLRLRQTHGAARGREYARQLENEHGRAGRALAAAVRKNFGGSLGYFELPMRERVLDSAVGAVVHSEAARRAIRAGRPCLPILRLELPVSIPAVPAEASAALRRRFGVRGDDFLVVSPGLATRAKRIDRLASAVAAARAVTPHVRLIVAGAVEPHSGIEEAARSAGGPDVVFTGRLADHDYFAALAAADVVACLRFPSAGESSLPVAQAMALGRPLLVSALPPFLEIEPRACRRIPVGEGEVEALTSAIVALARSPVQRRAMGEAAVAASRGLPSPERFARSLAAFVVALLPVSRARVASAARRLADGEQRIVERTWRFATRGLPVAVADELRAAAGIGGLVSFGGER